MTTPYLSGDRRSECAHAHPATALCAECGDRFEVRRPWQRFCRPKCKDAFRRRPIASVVPAAVVVDVRAQLQAIDARLARIESALSD
jgi:hypothetical protein